ncbi:MAG: hypothetical protein H0W13_07375, partial [Nitrospirales bacterium]|nr:hypothetical protein [Nitrospirales bacterium]
MNNVEMLAVVDFRQSAEGRHQLFTNIACRRRADDEAESIEAPKISGVLSGIEHGLERVDESFWSIRADNVHEQSAVDVNREGERNASDLVWFRAHANVRKDALCALTAENLS